MPLNKSGIHHWAIEFHNGERWECRRLRRLLWTLYRPRWVTRLGFKLEDIRTRIPCYLHGHQWREFEPVEGLADGRECDHCGKYEVGKASGVDPYSRAWFVVSAISLAVAAATGTLWLAIVAWLELWFAAMLQDRANRQ